jgi:AcrR family transcriptional regulator
MARPRNADGQRTRQAILDAALEVFAEKGYFGATLRDVAAVVGVRESALYNYFASKDALFNALIDADQHSKLERLSALADNPITDGRAVLEELALLSLESFATPSHEKLFRILMSDGIRLAKSGRINLVERMGHRRERFQALITRLIHDGWLRPGDPQMMMMAFTAPLIMWRHLYAIDANLPIIRNPRAFARQHVDQYLRGAAAASDRVAPAAPRAARRKAQKPRQIRKPRRPSL